MNRTDGEWVQAAGRGSGIAEARARDGGTDLVGPAPELGYALATRVEEICDGIVARWRRGQETNSEQDERVESDIRKASRAGTLAVADYLMTAQAITRERSELWDSAGEAPLVHEITISDVTKLYLIWRDLCLQVLQEEAAMRQISSTSLRQAMDTVSLGADVSLVRMAQRFEITRHQLEIQLAEKQARLEHQALHDPLTGLANRVLLLDRLDHALQGMERRGSRPAVLFMDLDHFKSVNDASGHSIGDQLLVEVAARLRAFIRPADTVARLGGDEFIVLCEDLSDSVGESLAVAARLAARLEEPFPIGGRDVFATASIGVAAAGPGDDAELLLARADRAMYRAKQLGRGRIELYDPAVDRAASRYAQLSAHLQPAMSDGQLHLAYQPVLSVAHRTTVAREALLRWQHPEIGAVAPEEFIPVAEETGLVTAIGRWVLDQACRDCAVWQACGEPHVGVSVNVSGRQLEALDFHDHVAGALDTSGLAPGTLTLEIAETLLVAGRAEARETLERLRALGVRIAIDDFGTGYSSLSWLARLPLDVLKIDRSFVAAVGLLDRESAIVQAMIRLAHTLGFRAVAEGVETATQLEHLEHMGCDQVQGYLLGRPKPIDTLRGPA